jgi:hypothetical protein
MFVWLFTTHWVKGSRPCRSASGCGSITWRGHDAFGRKIATGMYIYRLMTGSNDTMLKMTFSKLSEFRNFEGYDVGLG